MPEPGTLPRDCRLSEPAERGEINIPKMPAVLYELWLQPGKLDVSGTLPTNRSWSRRLSATVYDLHGQMHDERNDHSICNCQMRQLRWFSQGPFAS